MRDPVRWSRYIVLTTAVRLGYAWVDKALVGEYNLSYLALGLRYSF